MLWGISPKYFTSLLYHQKIAISDQRMNSRSSLFTSSLQTTSAQTQTALGDLKRHRRIEAWIWIGKGKKRLCLVPQDAAYWIFVVFLFVLGPNSGIRVYSWWNLGARIFKTRILVLNPVRQVPSLLYYFSGPDIGIWNSTNILGRTFQLLK